MWRHSRTALPALSLLASMSIAFPAPRDATEELKKGKDAYLKQDLKSAEKRFRAAVELQPDSYVGHLYLGHSLYFQQRFQEAIPEYQKAMVLGAKSGEMQRGDKRLLNDQLGMAFGMSGKPQEAKAVLEAALKDDPAYAMYYYNLACAHAELGHLEEALANLELGFARRGDMLPGEKYPNPRGDDSFKRYAGNERFEASMKRMGF